MHSVKVLSKESFKKEVIRNAKDTFEHYDVLRKSTKYLRLINFSMGKVWSTTSKESRF